MVCTNTQANGWNDSEHVIVRIGTGREAQGKYRNPDFDSKILPRIYILRK